MIQTIPINRLKCRVQVRKQFDAEALAGLAQTIRETGVLQPLLVRREGSEFIIVEGERRWRAATMAGLEELPVIVDDRELGEADVVYRQLVTNCSREGLDPLEKARAIDMYMKTANLTAAQVAVKLGMSPGMVSKLLTVLSLPENVQEQVSKGSLPVTSAYELSRAPDSESQQRLADEAASGKLTREAVVERTRSQKRGKRKAQSQRSRVRDKSVRIACDDGRTIALAGPALTLESVITWLAGLVDRLRQAESQKLDLAGAVKLASQVS